jgi:hypothetical protein
MSQGGKHDDGSDDVAELLRLLDEHFRLRDDPARRGEFQCTKARLKELLRRAAEDE